MILFYHVKVHLYFFSFLNIGRYSNSITKNRGHKRHMLIFISRSGSDDDDDPDDEDFRL